MLKPISPPRSSRNRRPSTRSSASMTDDREGPGAGARRRLRTRRARWPRRSATARRGRKWDAWDRPPNPTGLARCPFQGRPAASDRRRPAGTAERPSYIRREAVEICRRVRTNSAAPTTPINPQHSPSASMSTRQRSRSAGSIQETAGEFGLDCASKSPSLAHGGSARSAPADRRQHGRRRGLQVAVNLAPHARPFRD